MGNSQTASNHHRNKRLGRQRRLSEPHKELCDNQLRPSRLVSSSMSHSPLCTTPPRIMINGMDSMDEPTMDRPSSCGFDVPSTNNAASASLRRMQFLSSNSSTNVTARSLDESLTDLADLRMKPLSRAKSHSPLKQMRTYSYRSLSSEENALDKASCDLIRRSWQECLTRASATGKDVGYFVFQRIFQKHPELKVLFGMKETEELEDIPDDHEAVRHTRIFTNILHLAAKNVDELEPQVAPAIFKYGERHYTTKATEYMTEENVRMVCAQVVCTVCDLLGEEAQPQCVEAWIEMMRYLGRKLLDGYEYAKLTAKHRISINRNDHHLFLML